MRCVDVHIHLSDFSYQPIMPHVIEISKKAGVIGLVANSEDLQSSLTTLSLSEEYPSYVYPALGLHPQKITGTTLVQIDDIEAMIRSQKQRIVAIGEIGLDGVYASTGEMEDLQNKTFNRFLGLAEELRLPVIVHSRRAAGKVLDSLDKYDLHSAILHWYSGPVESVSRIVDRGYYVTFGPSILYAKHIQNLASEIPLDYILTESDGPVPYREMFEGKQTMPAFVVEVTKKLAAIKGLTLEQICSSIIKNVKTALPGFHG